MIDLLTVEGPLESDRLRWISDLYGRTDARYRRTDFLEHLFRRGPAGPALHSFAVDGGRAVAHSAVVPMRARHGRDAFLCGKVEALFVAESHRGRRGGGEPLVLTLLDALFVFAEERAFELLHAYVRPEVGRLFRGFEAVRVGEPSLVAVIRPASVGSDVPRARATALALAQATIRSPAQLPLGRTRPASLQPPVDADADLVEAAQPAVGSWTVLGADSWAWYCASPYVRVLELPGRDGGRALVQVPGTAGDPLRVVAWRPQRESLRSGIALGAAAARLAHRTGSGTLRFQPWPAPGGDASLARALRMLGFVRRHDFTTLYVRARDPALARADAVVPTPLLYLGF